jgi:hypothetical protein
MAYQSILNPHPVTGPLTDAQLRATPVPVSGTVSTGGLTDTQLRASAVPMSIAALPALATGGNVIGAVTQSGTWNIGSITTLPALVAGTALIGKVGIDQTTPGTTNAFSLAQIGANTVLTGNGVAGVGAQRVTIASDNTPFPIKLDQTTPGTTNAVALAQIGGNTILTGNGVTGTGSQRVTIASDNSNIPTNIVQMGGVAVTMGSGVTGTGVQRVVLATDVALPTGANTIGALTANQSVNNAQFNGVTPLMGNGVTGTGSLRVTIASDNTAFSVNATGPTLTKGTQGSTGFSVQELKDAGRSCLAMTAQFAFAQTAETLLTMTLSTDGGGVTTFSSRVITSGKRFRIQSVTIEVETLGSGTAPQRAYLRLRRNTAGATTATSALQTVWCCANNTAIVKSAAFMDYEVPDGMEMLGDGTGTFGFTLETPDWVATTGTGAAKITIIGFEY